MFKRSKNNGFTLVELIVVIVILAILIGVSIGGIYSWVGKSRKSADINNLNAVYNSLQTLQMDEVLRKEFIKACDANTTLLGVESRDTATPQNLLSGYLIAWSDNDITHFSKNAFNGNGTTPYEQGNSEYIVGTWHVAASQVTDDLRNKIILPKLQDLYPNGIPSCKQAGKCCFLAIYATGDRDNPVGTTVGICDLKDVRYNNGKGNFNKNIYWCIKNAEHIWGTDNDL